MITRLNGMRILQIALLLWIVVAAADEPTSQPSTQPIVPQFTEPAIAHLGVGRVNGISNLNKIGPLSKVEVVKTGPSGAAPLRAEQIPEIFRKATPIAADDKLLDEWQYAPWCDGQFEIGGQQFRVIFYLGGLGAISNEAGQPAFFRFDPPKGT